MLGTLDFTGSEQWAPFSFSKSTALKWYRIRGKIINNDLGPASQYS